MSCGYAAQGWMLEVDGVHNTYHLLHSCNVEGDMLSVLVELLLPFDSGDSYLS